jgi:hypothetical protein
VDRARRERRHLSRVRRLGRSPLGAYHQTGSITPLEAGDRQPNPVKGPPQFYGVFALRLEGGSWKIVSAG